MSKRAHKAFIRPLPLPRKSSEKMFAWNFLIILSISVECEVAFVVNFKASRINGVAGGKKGFIGVGTFHGKLLVFIDRSATSTSIEMLRDEA
jgi:hypothetical protein